MTPKIFKSDVVIATDAPPDALVDKSVTSTPQQHILDHSAPPATFSGSACDVYLEKKKDR
jgi:hypothetical protein